MDILRWILIGVSVPVLGWLVIRTKRNAETLNKRIDEYHKEQEELEQQGKGKRGPVNPYEQMAELFIPKEEDKKDK